MTDQKQIITGLQEAAAYFRSSFDAMYGTVACEKFRNLTDAIEQAIALLKAQEAMEPTKPDEDNMVYCGACGAPVGYEVLEPPGMDYIRYNYCPNCGRAVKWE